MALQYKGKRIRASDKRLVYRFFTGTLLFLFIVVLMILNMGQLMRTDWETFSLLDNRLSLSPYNFITIIVATGICVLVAFLYYCFCYDSYKQLNPIADTVANATFQGADVDWFIKADDIVLKGKGGQQAGNLQNNQQGQPKK